MSMQDQKAEWLKSHPNATLDEAFEAGYFTCSSNWCNKRR